MDKAAKDIEDYRGPKDLFEDIPDAPSEDEWQIDEDKDHDIGDVQVIESDFQAEQQEESPFAKSTAALLAKITAARSKSASVTEGQQIPKQSHESTIPDKKQSKQDQNNQIDSLLADIQARKRIRLEANSIDRKYNRIFKTKPVNSQSVNVRLSDDSKGYLLLRDENYFSQIAPKPQKKGQLLSRPIEDIISDVIRKKSQNMELKQQQQQQNPITQSMRRIPEEKLWVDKYKPNNFLDLLSDEATNREILRWIKSWDEAVFNRPPPQYNVRETEFPQSYLSKSSVFSAKDKGGTESRPRFTKNVTSYIGNDGLPIKKIILLSGPPGLGKTTLAHILAKHAGYSPIEINASEDRTAESLQTKIVNAMEISSAFSGQKPSLLILDEIDGAVNDGSTKGAIQVLVNMIQSSSSGSKSDMSAKGSKKLKASKITKPIIAICNDPYVPALRPLREVALTFTIRKASAMRLANRLQEISQIEGISCDLQSLIALCELSSNDIRSCLNTLQFLRKKGSALETKSFTNHLVGKKDMKRSELDVWKDIFRKPNHSQAMLALRNRSKEPQQQHSIIDDSQSRLYESILSNGETDRLMDGCYESFLRMRYIDPTMVQTSRCYEWIGEYDILNRSILSRQNWSLMKYLPFSFIALHNICAESGEPTITFPSEEREFAQKKRNIQSILQLTMESAPHLRYRVGERSFALEYPSHLMTILSTNLKQTNVSLMQANEVEELGRVVAAHLSMGCVYSHQSSKDGETTHQLEPRIDTLATFPGSSAGGIKLMGNHQKALIQQHIDRVKSLGYDLKNIDNPASLIRESQPTAKKEFEHPQKTPTRSAPMKSMSEKAVPRDFFGRPINPRTPSPEKGAPTGSASSAASTKTRPPVLYRFQEGFTNAVRRPVYLRDLLFSNEG
eukprot:TRINITY_DN6105_c0_g1_i1.p1 TRINITY_DN6105_c0_g1~~TRINITY_DN6105_c0_g1_i1.p1  ORF type:complete len:903 (-),score=198.56 TRINITY_DN6105_c0_g1_i1:40-2748(-)